jgi:hypothetical protein
MQIPEQLLVLTDTLTHEKQVQIGNTPYVGVQLRVSPLGQLYYAETVPNGQLNNTVIDIAMKHTLLPYVDWRQTGNRFESLLSNGAHSENQLYPYYLLQLAALINENELQAISQSIAEHLKTIPVPTS